MSFLPFFDLVDGKITLEEFIAETKCDHFVDQSKYCLYIDTLCLEYYPDTPYSSFVGTALNFIYAVEDAMSYTPRRGEFASMLYNRLDPSQSDKIMEEFQNVVLESYMPPSEPDAVARAATADRLKTCSRADMNLYMNELRKLIVNQDRWELLLLHAGDYAYNAGKFIHKDKTLTVEEMWELLCE